MKHLKQLGIILILLFIGEGIQRFSKIPIPGNIIGMVLLTILLKVRIIKVSSVKEVSDFFLMNIAFFFIAPGITLLKSASVIKPTLFKVLAVITLSTFTVIAVTGITVELVIRLLNKSKGIKVELEEGDAI